MSRKRKSRFNAISVDDGNALREEALKRVADSRRSAPTGSEAQRTIEQRRASVEQLRNRPAAQEGLRQRDIRQRVRAFTPGRGLEGWETNQSGNERHGEQFRRVTNRQGREVHVYRDGRRVVDTSPTQAVRSVPAAPGSHADMLQKVAGMHSKKAKPRRVPLPRSGGPRRSVGAPGNYF